VLKEKRWLEDRYGREAEEGVEVIEAVGEDQLRPDEMGWFRIQVDRERKQVVAAHFRDADRPDLTVLGRDATEMYQTILRRGLVGNLDHAAYLGKELAKAELALRLGRSYLQDEPLF
jgi:dihydropteroate synthase